MTDDTARSDEVSLDRLRDIVHDIRIAMITTEGTDGTWHSRPMYLQDVEDNGDLWFATSSDSPLAEQVRHDGRVIASFAKPSDHMFAVIRGTAALHHDPALVEKFWSPAMKAWFPDGPNDPTIRLVQVRAEHGDFWDAPNAPVRIVKYVSALLTGSRAEMGDRVHVDLGTGTSSNG